MRGINKVPSGTASASSRGRLPLGQIGFLVPAGANGTGIDPRQGGTLTRFELSSYSRKSGFVWRIRRTRSASTLMALHLASPSLLRTTVGIFLIGYAATQLTGIRRWSIGDWGGRAADRVIGSGGGFLGGFAGLSGPLPLSSGVDRVQRNECSTSRSTW